MLYVGIVLNVLLITVLQKFLAGYILEKGSQPEFAFTTSRQCLIRMWASLTLTLLPEKLLLVFQVTLYLCRKPLGKRYVNELVHFSINCVRVTYFITKIHFV